MEIIVVKHPDDLQDIRESFGGNRTIDQHNIMLLSEAKEINLVPGDFEIHSIYHRLDTEELNFDPTMEEFSNSELSKELSSPEFRKSVKLEIIRETLVVSHNPIKSTFKNELASIIINGFLVGEIHDYFHEKQNDFCIHQLITAIVMKEDSIKGDVKEFTDEMILEAQTFLLKHFGFVIEPKYYDSLLQISHIKKFSKIINEH